MNSSRSLRWGIIIFSLLAITVLVFSLLNTRPAAPVTPTPGPPTATFTPDPCSEANLEATIRDFDKLSRQFSDRFVLAQNTPAAQLADIITEMQDIRRSAEDYAIPLCLNTLKNHQLAFMTAAIDATLSLYSSFSGDQARNMTQEQVQTVIGYVQQRIADAGAISEQYTAEMARLLGIPLPTPTAWLIPDLTVTPTETPKP